MPAGLRSEDLPAGEGLQTQIRRVRVGEGHVLLARLTTGEVVAFGPSCPHQFTELDDATIVDGSLRCPRHGYTFDPRTGENIHPRRDAAPENMWKLRPGYLPCYSVLEEEGWISVSSEAQPPPASYDPTLETRPTGTDAAEDPVASVGGGSTTVGAAGDSAAAVAAHSMKFVNAVAGAGLEIRLPFLPQPGFAWRFDMVGDLLQVVDEQFEPGYSPCHVLQLEAHGAGAATLTCTYATDEGVRADVRTFIVRVQPA